MKHLIKNFKLLSILILAISLTGCEDDDTILPEVIAGFTHTMNVETGTVTFINTSENASKYEWDFGDDSTSTLNNPINTYESGTYTIILKAKNVAGASDTFEDTITINIPVQMSLPVTFDDPNVIYDIDTFNGVTFEIVDNPDLSGTNNTASQVGAITNSGAAWEGINFDVGVDIDLTVNKTITLNFWADAAVDVLLKLEEGTGADIELTSSHGGTGWEKLSFDFNSSNKYSRLTLFVNGPGTTAGTFYIDDILQVLSAPVITLIGDDPMNVTIGGSFTDPGATAIDGHGADISSSIITGGDTVDENVAGTYIITYDVSDNEGNAAIQVTRTVIVANDAVAPVITLIGDATMNVEIGGTFTDPGVTAADDVDGDITSSIVVAGDTVDVNTAGTYTITYNVNDAAGNPATEVTRTVIVAAAGACTTEATESMSASNLDITFMTDQSANIISDGAGFEWVDNPDSDNALNSSCKVGKINKSGQFPWDNNQIDLDAKLDFDNNTGLKIKVYSAVSGFRVRLKLEEIGNAGNNVELELTTTKTNEWEELTFPFSSADSNKFDKIVIFFDLNASNTDTYYFDDLKLYGTGSGGGGGGGGGCDGCSIDGLAENGDFETGNLDGWAVYENGGSITVDNTQSSGGTFSAKMVADPNGQNPTLKQERKGAGTISVGDQVQITFDYMGSLEGISGIYSFQSFVEAANGVNQVETFAVTPTDTWQTFTTTYTVSAGDVSGGITTEFVAICGGVEGCITTLYLDNVSAIINP